MPPLGGRGAHFMRLLGWIFLIACLLVAAGSRGGAALENCPYTGNAGGLKEGQKLTCYCPAGDGGWRVYGSDRYTGDSGLCGAAVHAGAISTVGGEVTVYGGGGCESFAASDRNGVSSVAYGHYAPTFGFSDPLPPCAELARAQATAARMRAECVGRGRESDYCDCEVKLLTDRLGGGGVTLLHAMNDQLRQDQKVSSLASSLSALLADKGLGFASLPGLKDSIGDMRIELAKVCGP